MKANASYIPTVIPLTYAQQYMKVGQVQLMNTLQIADMIRSQRAIDPHALATRLGRPPEVKEIKAAGPIIYWARWTSDNPGAKERTPDSSCIGVSAIWFDYDSRGGNAMTRVTIQRRCEGLGIECLIWNTFSSTGDGRDFRVVFPLSKPIPLGKYRAAFEALFDLLGPGVQVPADESLVATQGTFITPRWGGIPSDPQVVQGRPADTHIDVDSLTHIQVAEAGMRGDAGLSFDCVFNETQKEMYRRALDFIDSYPRENWLPVLGAGMRGWAISPAIAADKSLQSESQRNLLAMLDRWAKEMEQVPPGEKSKYRKGCVESNVSNALKGGTRAGIRAVVRRAAAESGGLFKAEIEAEPSLLSLYQVCVEEGDEEEPSISDAEIAEAITVNERRIAERKARMGEHEREIATLIHEMPPGQARDFFVTVASKGEVLRYADLPFDYEFPMDTTVSLLGGLQMADTVLGNRVWLNTGELGTLASNLYVLLIAGSGWGKSLTANFIADCLIGCGYGHAVVRGKSHSGGGFFNNFLDKGPVVYQMIEEAEEWFSGMEVSGGGMVANQSSLNTMILQLFNQSRMGGSVETANLMSDRVAGKVRKTAPVIEPHLNMMLIGTYELETFLTEKLVNDGYLARFLMAFIPYEDDVEEALRRKIARQIGEGDGRNAYKEGVSAVSECLKQFDIDLETYGRGRSMVSLTTVGAEFLEDGEDAKTGAELFRELQNNRITEDRTNALVTMTKDLSQLLFDSVIPLERLSRIHHNLMPIAKRELEKVQRISLILTMLDNPAASKLSPEMVRFASKFCSLLQKPWIERLTNSKPILINRSNTLTPIVDKLRAELGEDRPLFNAPAGLSAGQLRDSSRHWRDLFKILNSPVQAQSEDALKVLTALGVVRIKGEGKRGYIYFHPDHAPEGEFE